MNTNFVELLGWRGSKCFEIKIGRPCTFEASTRVAQNSAHATHLYFYLELLFITCQLIHTCQTMST